MFHQTRYILLLLLLMYSGFSLASVSNPIKNKDKIEILESTAKIDNSDASTAGQLISLGDHEQDFERSLQKFDEKLLRELEEAQQERQENARQKAVLRSDAELEAESEGQNESETAESGNASNEESNETAGSEGLESGEEESEQTETANNSGQDQTSSGERQGSTNTEVNSVPTGDDDDIIARQLREAAEAETDPEIKEKLWAEYRKYKNQQSPSTGP